MLKDIKDFHLDNRPIFAECGGLMYLMNSIHEDKVVDVYPYKSVLTDRVQALKYTIAEVSDRMGYSDPKYFTDVFKKHYGTTPSAYMKNPES